MRHRLAIILIALGGAVILAAAGLSTFPASAARQVPGEIAPRLQAPAPTRQPNLSISDETCLGCHGQPGQSLPLGDGDTLDLYVNPQDHAASVHGQLGYACAQCHTDVGEYPHPAFSAADRREVTLKLNAVCERCHAPQAQLAGDSVHAIAQANGNRFAATCTDCHTAHTVRPVTDPKTGTPLTEAHLAIPQTCAQCHSTIYEKYIGSVHGAALTEGNLDVPTCVDCHGVHNITSPTTAAYRLRSPQMCAGCHTDPKRMGKYGISTDVLSTYVADFHGTTVELFEKQSPDAETNKPVCFDCHGVHDIARPDDPQKGLQVRQNLLKRCQVCHPDASADFPTAWMSHYIPSPEKYPLVYYINLFYQIFIPVLLGGMGVLVAMDFGRRMINRYGKKPPLPPAEAPETAPEPQAPPAPEAAAPPPEAPGAVPEATQPVEESEPPAVESPQPVEASPVGEDIPPESEAPHIPAEEEETPPAVSGDHPDPVDPVPPAEEAPHE